MCHKYGHSANECNNEQDCLRCSKQMTVKNCTEPKEHVKCAKCGESHAYVYRRCSYYQFAFVEATKRKQDIKYSAVARGQLEMLHPTSFFSLINIKVLVA